MAKTGDIIVLVPVVNYDLATVRIQLTNTLAIRQISASELDTLMKHTPEYYRELNHAIGKAKFVIERRINPDKVDRYWSYVVLEQTDKINLALRVLGLEPMRMPVAFCLTIDSSYFENFMADHRTLEEKHHILTKDQILELKSVWRSLQGAEKKKPYLQFALSQFATSSGHSNEEKFIDYITAFESIVFARGTNAPYPYGRAIGIAIGMLIGRSERERLSIEQRLNEAYEIRNKVVHGHLRYKLGDPDSEHLEKLLNFTEGCLVKCLRKLLAE